MKIGIDISQIAFSNTGVANYLENLLANLLKKDQKNEYILFGSSLRQRAKYQLLNNEYKGIKNVRFKIFPFPPTFLDFLWNKLHIIPIEWFIGEVDIFVSSDWIQPPTKKAKKLTILYDLIIYKYPLETHNKFGFDPSGLVISPNIVASQKRRLRWVKKECDQIICISEATKKDAMELLKIEEKRLRVIYPGI